MPLPNCRKHQKALLDQCDYLRALSSNTLIVFDLVISRKRKHLAFLIYEVLEKQFSKMADAGNIDALESYSPTLTPARKV